MGLSLAVLIPVSIGMGVIGLAAFVWAVRHGQFDDPEGASWRILPPDADPVGGRSSGQHTGVSDRAVVSTRRGR